MRGRNPGSDEKAGPVGPYPINGRTSLAVRIKRRAAYLALGLCGLAAMAPAIGQMQEEDSSAFSYEERSTVDTIPLQSMDQEALSNTVIEGGLAPADSGRQPPNPQSENFSPFTDPLLLTIDDPNINPNRFSLDFDIQFQNPKSVPGIEFGNSYNIAPQPNNRVYNFYDFTTTER